MTKRILGYQVVDGAQCHPDPMWSFELYSKDVCQGYVDREPERYRLVTIREGDVEEPVLIINLSPITNEFETRENIIRFFPKKDGVATVDSFLYDEKADDVYNAMAHTIESMVLAQGCAGIDILSPKYREALQTVLDKIHNEYEEN